MFLSFKTQNEKKLRFEFTESQITMFWNTLEFCKNSIQTSQSPAVEVNNVRVLIDSIQRMVKAQYLLQTDTTKK